MSQNFIYFCIAVIVMVCVGLLMWALRSHVQNKRREAWLKIQEEARQAVAPLRKEKRASASNGEKISTESDTIVESTEIPSKVPRGRASSVLLVEDSSTARLQMRKILERWNFRVTTASNGREAWAEMKRFKPDIVVSDIDMPEMTGLELLELIRSDLVLVDVPVILITGSAELHLKAGKKAGINGLLAKPFDEKTLVEQIRYILQE